MSFGVQNGIDPYGSFSPISVNSPNVTGATVTLTDPGSSPVTTAPTLTAVTGFDSGAVIQFKPAVNSNGTETPSSYTLQWSTTSTFSTIAGSKAFIATGPNIDVWFATTGLFDGNSYYFRAYGSSLGTPSGGPYSTVYGPVTIGAPSTGSSVSGAVSFTGTAIGPMYVGLYNPNVPGAVYLQYIANPVSSQAYTVTVPNSTTPVYVPVAFIDQNGTGVIEPGDITNVQIGLQGVPIAVTGNMANVNITLPSADSVALAITANKLTGSTESYGLTLYTNWLGKLPVGVTLEPSSNPDGANVTGPVDIASCSVPDNTNCNGFQLTFSLGTTVPTVGDTYLLNFKYSDGTSGLVAAPVTAVLNTFATNLGPTTGTSTPTFSWIGPVCSACNTYNYEFNIYIPNGNSIWYVPGNSTGLPYTTTSLTWGVDPTDSSNKPSPSSLTAGTTYDWSITVQDPYYNSATTIVSYTP